MKAVMRVVASAAGLFTLAFVVLDSSPAAASAQRPETYCLGLGDGGTDCSFTSLAQCQASASGRNAICFRDASGSDDVSLSSASAPQAPQVPHSRISRGMRR
jgi:Protein of unknown function (DUF3551)